MRLKSYAAAIAVALLLTMVAVASPIKVWIQGDALTSADLNANFQHIHNLMVGSHGPRLVDGDVSSSAGIKYSKMESQNPVARAWGTLHCPAGGAGCTMAAGRNSLNISSASGNFGFITVNYGGVSSGVFLVVTTTSVPAQACGVITQGATNFVVGCASAVTAMDINFVAFST
jgi:hypothetical protein